MIFRQILFKFFGPTSEYFAKYNAFCLHIFDYACLRRKAYCNRRGSRLWKNCIHQKHFWKWLVGGCIAFLSFYPARPAPGHKVQKPSKKFSTDMGKLQPADPIRPASSFILARQHLQKLKLPPWIERKTFFSIRDHGGSDFKKKQQRCKIEMKNEAKTFYFGDHIRTWSCDFQKKERNKGLHLIACGLWLQQFFQIWPFMWKVCPPLV